MKYVTASEGPCKWAQCQCFHLLTHWFYFGKNPCLGVFAEPHSVDPGSGDLCGLLQLGSRSELLRRGQLLLSHLLHGCFLGIRPSVCRNSLQIRWKEIRRCITCYLFKSRCENLIEPQQGPDFIARSKRSLQFIRRSRITYNQGCCLVSL